MNVILGRIVTLDFTTHDPLSGQVSDADVLPTCEVFEDNTDIPILTPLVTKRTAKTGNYRVTFTASTANGFEIGKSYNVISEATVNSITAKARIAAFIITSGVAVSTAHFNV